MEDCGLKGEGGQNSRRSDKSGALLFTSFHGTFYGYLSDVCL